MGQGLLGPARPLCSHTRTPTETGPAGCPSCEVCLVWGRFRTMSQASTPGLSRLLNELEGRGYTVAKGQRNHSVTAFDPAELGYFEMRPGSGIWSHPDKGRRKFRPRLCVFCGDPYMAGPHHNKKGYCSLLCVNRASGRERGKLPAGYTAKHARVGRARGKASEYSCADGCGNQAQDWSQTHGTTGDEPEHYEPRCRKCHKTYDIANVARGDRVNTSILTEASVRAIRASVGATQAELAVSHRTSQANIYRILHGQTWRHVS